jgi:peroxiredoxin Q/BCP
MKYLAPVIGFALTMAAVTSTAAELKVGDPAPDFSLPATDGKTYKLSDFKNKETVVLAWFPKAYTSGCTIECKSLAKNGHLIKKYQASYFMISTDPLETNKSFGAEQGADFPLLSDPTKATANAYGVLGIFGVPNRYTYYIGADGKILAIDKSINPATSAEDMAAMLGKLRTPARN